LLNDLEVETAPQDYIFYVYDNPWVFCAQRFALADFGRAGIMFKGRKNSKPEKCLKMPQNPTRQVHALLGGAMLCKTRWLLKNLLAQLADYLRHEISFFLP